MMHDLPWAAAMLGYAAATGFRSAVSIRHDIPVSARTAPPHCGPPSLALGLSSVVIGDGRLVGRGAAVDVPVTVVCTGTGPGRVRGRPGRVSSLPTRTQTPFALPLTRMSRAAQLGRARRSGRRRPVFMAAPLQMATVDDLVGPAVFLASDASRFCTGIDLIVNGGYVCW
jgi:hypothetical protein